MKILSFFLILFQVFVANFTFAQTSTGRWFEKDGSERKDIARLALNAQTTIEGLNFAFEEYKKELISKEGGLFVDIQKTNEKFKKFDSKLIELQRQSEGDRALGIASVLTSQKIKTVSDLVHSVFFQIYERQIKKIESLSFPEVPTQNIYDAPIKGFVGWILGSKDHARQVQALMVGADPIDFKEDMPAQKLKIFRQLNFLKNEERYGFLSGLRLLEKRRTLVLEILNFERSLVAGALPNCPRLLSLMGSEAPSKKDPTVAEVLDWAKNLEKQISADLKYFNTPDGNLKLEGLAAACNMEHPTIDAVVLNLKRLLNGYSTLYKIEERSALQAERLGFDPIRFRLDPRILGQKCK